MTVLLCLAAVSCWAAVQMQPGTILPPFSWPVISACMWLAHLHIRPRLDGTDKRQAFAGLLSAAMLFVFLLQDGEFSSWGDVYFFCGSRMQYCTCAYRWNLVGWIKAFILWAFVLLTTLGVQRLMVQLVLRGLLPGEEVVTRESFISIGWRLIPYWLNNWEQQWGAECSSMMFELPQFAVELVIILPCVQILCSRMKVLAMPSVNAALPRGWDGASAEQIREAFVPNVQRGCWERRPEQHSLKHRLKANRHVTAFAALLCLLAGFNSLVIPLHLENVVLAHPRAASMQAVGRLPQPWSNVADLTKMSGQLQRGELNLTLSTVTHKALDHLLHNTRAAGWSKELQDVSRAEQQPVAAAHTAPMAGRLPEGGSFTAAVVGVSRVRRFALWMDAVEEGPWQDNRTWASAAVAELAAALKEYQVGPNACPDASRFKHVALKNHNEIFRMQDPSHRVSIPLIEAALALMRLSTEKFFVLLSLYVAFLLYREPPPHVAALIGINAHVSNAFARLVLYAFPMVCWVYGAGVVFSTLVSVVFWGGPLWQVYHGLRTHACTVSVKGLRPATAAEIERMHDDCAICWCPMTVAGAARRVSSPAQEAVSTCTPGPNNAASNGATCHTNVTPTAAGTSVDTAAAAGSVSNRSGVSTPQQPAALASAAATSSASEQQQQLQPGELADTDGSTLPCGHCYHEDCVTKWLQQCHGQGSPPTCPMCQGRLQLAVKWHLWKALFAPSVWQLPVRRRGRLGADEAAAVGVEGEEAPDAEAHHNNYLLLHNPRLAELLADMPLFVAPENVQLLADVQELRWQRQQLVNELAMREQLLQRIDLRLRHHEQEMRLDLQQQQLLNELQWLRQQMQLQQEPAPQPQPQQEQQPEQPANVDVMHHMQLVAQILHGYVQPRDRLAAVQPAQHQQQQQQVAPQGHSQGQHQAGLEADASAVQPTKHDVVAAASTGHQPQDSAAAHPPMAAGRGKIGCSSSTGSGNSRAAGDDVAGSSMQLAALGQLGQCVDTQPPTTAGQAGNSSSANLAGPTVLPTAAGPEQQQQQQRQRQHPLLRLRQRFGRRA